MPVGVREKKAELILRLVTGAVKEGPKEKMQVVPPVTENPRGVRPLAHRHR